MGNAFPNKNGGGNDEENTLATSVADAAATGARQAVIDEVQKAQLGGVGGGQEIVPEGALIAGVLPVALAEAAAAAGAERAIDAVAKDLKLASRSASDLKRLKVVAGSGAKGGVKAVALKLMQPDIEGHAMEDIDLEIAAAAADAGAWVSCFFLVQTGLTTTPNASKYTSLLGPMLGGSMPTSAAVYHLLNSSSDIVKLCAFGGITLGVFVISSGLIAGLLGTTPGSVRYTRIATMAVLFIVLTFFAVVLCTLFHSTAYKAACGAVCGVLIALLFSTWWYFGW